LVTTTHKLKIAADPHDLRLGSTIRSLRLARKMTQDVLAEWSDLAPDTIRRLERGAFSPTMDTLRKLCRGLGMRPSTLLEVFEVGDRDQARELADLVRCRSAGDIAIATTVVRALFDGLDAAREISPLPVEQPAIAPVPGRAAGVLAK
jgi:transcriptional regulator with XRE-family HTH domain